MAIKQSYTDSDGNKITHSNGIDSVNGSLSSMGDSGGGASVVKPTITTFVGVAAQVFRCTCWGLKPNTLHKAYLLTKDVSSDCAPIVSNGTYTSTYSYGSQLVTNAEGKLVFDYRFNPSNSPFSTKQLQNSSEIVAIIPFGRQTFKVSSTDGNSYAQSFIESKQST